MFSSKKKYATPHAVSQGGKMHRAQARWLDFFQQFRWPHLPRRDNVHPIRFHHSSGGATRLSAQKNRRASFSAEAEMAAPYSFARLRNPYFWFSAVAALIFLAALVIYSAPKWLAQFPIHQVQFSGASHYVAQEQIKAAVEPYIGSGFFLADLSAIQKSVSDIPWVDTAKVTRKWPATLRVAVIERVPIAIWNSEYLVSNKGELFKPENLGVLPMSLPSISGPLPNSWLIMNQYQVISALLKSQQLVIRTFSLSSYLSWEMQLTNGIILRVDHDHAVEKIKQFLQLYPRLKPLSYKIAYVDLRYQKGAAVGWKK